MAGSEPRKRSGGRATGRSQGAKRGSNPTRTSSTRKTTRLSAREARAHAKLADSARRLDEIRNEEMERVGPPVGEASPGVSTFRAEVPPPIPTQPPPTRKKGRGPLSWLKELPGLILIAFLLALLIKTFLVQAFFIPSESMVPTLLVGDRVLVNKIVFDIGSPQRADVIVFENPQYIEPDRNPLSAFWHWIIEGLGVSSDPNKDFIKRVIGLPGDTVEVKNGRVYINGERIREPYLKGHRDRSSFGPVTVEEGHYFVMGDNRANSQDSRSSLGQIPEEKIVGKAFIRLWPPSRIGGLSGG